MLRTMIWYEEFFIDYPERSNLKRLSPLISSNEYPNSFNEPVFSALQLKRLVSYESVIIILLFHAIFKGFKLLKLHEGKIQLFYCRICEFLKASNEKAKWISNWLMSSERCVNCFRSLIRTPSSSIPYSENCSQLKCLIFLQSYFVPANIQFQMCKSIPSLQWISYICYPSYVTKSCNFSL